MELIGYTSGALIFCAYLFYIIAILKGATRPNRATWCMLTAISLVIALSYSDLGAEATLWAALADLGGTFIIAVLAIFYGVGGWEPFDKLCIVVAGICLGMYFVFIDFPLITLVASLLMDGAAMLPTIKHALYAPEEEDGLAWMITYIANILTIFAIQSWTIDIALYPFYMLSINALVVYFVFQHRVAARLHYLDYLFRR